MLKKLSLFALCILAYQNAFSQTILFQEDFEAASGSQNQATPYLGWQTGDFQTTPPTSDNYWWVFDNTRCSVISGNYSMAVSINTPVTSGTMPQYKSNKIASTLVYYTTPINATNYTGLTLDFNWICQGETGADYGTVLYSTNGTDWAALPGVYVGQSTTQSVTNLDLSVVNEQSFYLGFGWENDKSISGFPGFIVDDIVVKGTQLPTCTSPTAQPTALALTPSGDSILGSFTAASPAPTNYLVTISTSNVAPTLTDGTAYTIGESIGAATVVDIDSNTSFTATGLSASTTYYVYVFAYNSQCIGGPLYNATSPLNSSATTSNTAYCSALTTNSASSKYINDVQFLGTLNDVSNIGNGYSTSPNGYQDWTSLTKSIQAQGEGINVYVGSSTGHGHYKAWVDWNKDGDFLDTDELLYDTGSVATSTTTFGFTIPSSQAIGDYRLRIRFYYKSTNYAYDFSACETFDGNGGNAEYGETEDYLFTVIENCSAKITAITNGETCSSGPVDLTVTGSSDTIQFKWYDAETGGSLLATTSSGTWSPNISATTTYWVTATNGICESVARTKIVGYLNPTTTLDITPENPTACGVDDIIELSATGETEIAYLIDEDFESGLGSFSSVNYDSNSATIDNISMWQIQTSTYIPSLYVWEPAISSGFGANQFVMTTSDVSPSYYLQNALESSSMDTSTFTDLTLSFDMYFSRYLYDNSNSGVTEYINIEVSTNGGTSWTSVQTYDDDIGYGTDFATLTLDLSAYIDQTNLKVRFFYYAAWCDGVALDNIQLYGTRPLNPAFNWSGSPTVDAYTDSAATIPYVQGTTISTVYIKPTLDQLELSEFTFTATATLSNGCDINKDITITNNSKVWRGDLNGSTSWDNPLNWKPNGVPTSDNCVIIVNSECNLPNNLPPIPPVLYEAYAKNLTIKSTGNLNIMAGNYLTVTDEINIEDNTDSSVKELDVREGSSIIQVSDGAVNSGTAEVQRMAYVLDTDYVYWSSPVTNFNVNDVTPGISSSFIWKWSPTLDNGGTYASNFGKWITASGNTMTNGKGYIVRAGNNNSDATLDYKTTTFRGVLNNGTVTIPISRGTYDGANYVGPSSTMVTKNDDNWNLIGNPYPSGLDALSFVTYNTNIEGAVHIWTHGTQLSAGNADPFYDDYVLNYSANDYFTYNATGSNTYPNETFDGKIASGQGFFVLMLHSSSSTSETVTFNNSMRLKDNSNFFKSSTTEKNRIWLNLISPNQQLVSNSMVGYVTGATLQKDRLYDAYGLDVKNMSLYSLIGNEGMVIQGRPVPFDQNDQVPLGINITTSGIHTIAIDAVDGIFETTNQDIYLEDTYLGMIHDLKSSPYTFQASPGNYNDRFILRYTNASLSIDDDTLSGVKIFTPNSEMIKIVSKVTPIENVKVFDVLGRVLLHKTGIDSDEFTTQNPNNSSGTYIIEVTLSNNAHKTQKVILK